MSDQDNEQDLERTQALYAFLQGELPEGCILPPGHQPKLTPDQAWTVIWYLGNQYWQVTDHVERCDVCGELYNDWCEGDCMDYGRAPYHFCGECLRSDAARRKRRIGLRLERARRRDRKATQP